MKISAVAKEISQKGLLLYFVLFPISAAGFSPIQKAPVPETLNSIRSSSILFNKGEKFRLEGDFEKSENLFSRSLAAARKEKNLDCELDALIGLGLIHWNVGQIKESADFFTDALAVAKDSSKKEQEEFCSSSLEIYRLYQEAKALRASGEYDDTIGCFKKAIELAIKNESPEHEVKCLRQLSIIYWELNNLNEYYLYSERALKIAQALNHKKEEAYCFNNIGLYYWKIDSYSNSLLNYEKALSLSREIHNIQIQSDCLNNIGLIYREMGNYEKAAEFLNQALIFDQQLGIESQIAIDLNNIGAIYVNKGFLSGRDEDYNNAIASLFNCLDIAKRLKLKNTEIRVLNNIGGVNSDRGYFKDAISFFEQAYKAASEVNDRESMSMILNNMGIVQFNLGNFPESTKLYQRAIDLAYEINGGQVLWEAYLELANSYKKQNNVNDALINYKNSIEIIEGIRSSINLEELKASYLGTDKRIDAYQNLIDLTANLGVAINSRHSNKFGIEAFNYLERAKARAFLDSLEVSEVGVSQGIDFKLANQEKEIMNAISGLYTKLLAPELNQVERENILSHIKSYEEKTESLKREIRSTSPAYANLKYPEVITYDEVQKELTDSETMFLAYSLGKDQSFGFAIKKGSMKVFRAPARKTIQQHVTDYRKAISDKDNHDFRLGRILFDELVRPGLSKGIKKLIIIPDDILSLLPFETLVMDNPKERWLIQNYAIAYVPSLSSLRELDIRKRTKASGTRKDLLAFGDPYYGVNEESTRYQGSDIFQDFYSSSAVNFYRLKYSGLEIQKIASLFKTTRVRTFQREEATEDRIKSEDLSAYRIVHLATHGLIDDKKPARSSIILALDRDPAEDGFLQMREIFNLKLNADVVVLSACQTGLGQFIRGEGIEGLSRAFFYAGASSVLMSLWAVNDEATYQLMERLYHHLRSADPPITALRKAKLEMIDSEALSHPYYWAGFIIHGKTSRVVFPSILNRPILLVSSILLGIMLVLAIRNLNKKRA